MKSLFTKIIAALFVMGVLAGCATTGDQENAIDWLDRTAEQSNTE